MNDNYTPRANQAINLAKKEALSYNQTHVGTEHLLLGIIKLNQGVGLSILARKYSDISQLEEKLINLIAADDHAEDEVTLESLSFTPRLNKVLQLAKREAKNLKHSYIGTEHLLLGLLTEGESTAAQLLIKNGVNLDETREDILAELDPNQSSYDEDGNTAVAGGQPSEKRGKASALKAFGKDLNELARNNQLDPVIGRKDEIERIIQVLGRRTKNNPILLGEAGVGKTALAEGIAQEIVKGNVPERISNKRIIILDMALMVAGTKYRGQFEERIKAVMDEVRKDKNVILFLDEIHTIVGAGSGEGSMDASNMIKPALGRGEFQVIGATTLKEYRKYIEKDTALARRFQQVFLEPPSVDDSIAILNGLAPQYESHHNVIYSTEAIEACVKLSDRYIPTRHLPDKAIDLMDESGSKARMKHSHKSPEIEILDKEIKDLVRQKDIAVSTQKFEEAAVIRSKETELSNRRDKLIKDWKESRTEETIVISEDDVREILSKMTGIPLNKMDSTTSNNLLNLEEELNKSVIGQTESISALARSIRRSRSGLSDAKRPIGSFLFLGSTGVGKTHLAKTLASNMFGSEDAMTRLDMSEYMEKHTVSRLIGSPPGYVGYGEGGHLTEAVRKRPYSVVLFDEIEKAHPDVLQILLQIMDDGHITDSQGTKVDFRNTLIILTSNIGAHLFSKQSAMGFAAMSSDSKYETLKDDILAESKKVLKPEFLNRLTDIIVFRPLGKDEFTHIVDLEVQKVIDRLKDQKISFTLTKNMKNYLLEQGTDEKYGARPLRRAVERHIEDNLADALLRNEIRPGMNFKIDLVKDKVVIKTPKSKEVKV